MHQDRGLNASWVSNKLHIYTKYSNANVFPVVACPLERRKYVCARRLLTNFSKIFSVEIPKFTRKLPKAIRAVFRYFRSSPKTSEESELAKGLTEVKSIYLSIVVSSLVLQNSVNVFLFLYFFFFFFVSKHETMDAKHI